MTDISHENPMYCEISPPTNGPRKYAMLTLSIENEQLKLSRKKIWRINEQWTWFVVLHRCHHMRFRNLSQIPCHRHKCILSRRLMLTVVLAPHLMFRYLKQWICHLIFLEVCLFIDLPIPRAKCGRTNDAIEFACGICRWKISIRLFSRIFELFGWFEERNELKIQRNYQ